MPTPGWPQGSQWETLLALESPAAKVPTHCESLGRLFGLGTRVVPPGQRGAGHAKQHPPPEQEQRRNRRQDHTEEERTERRDGRREANDSARLALVEDVRHLFEGRRVAYAREDEDCQHAPQELGEVLNGVRLQLEGRVGTRDRDA